MSLPPGFLDELRTRLSLTDVVGRKVMWDTRKSNQAKGDMWAPCPFHQEKSASFHVDDRKGFYYCFGCHAKGDAISFVRETENVGFMEAIEILAGEAGMQMPARDPQAKEKADRRTELAQVMDEAVRWMRLQMKTAAASEARTYLASRGLSEKTQDRFEIGFAPSGRQPMFQALTAKAIPAQHLIDTGLCAKSDRGDVYDRFAGRIIYPIRDPRGRCIGLGGRAMSPEARAKYLNSPETELFDKGRSLYNHGPAREAAGKGQPLIVAEGYMDVIALVDAGFGATVAPLGTAITEDQLRLLWRISPEPIITLDGDAAGQRAAMRLIDLAFPLLEAGQSLRFCILPDGLDPDDLLKSKGPQAMQALLDQARPMVSLLWQRETEGVSLDSPERRAALDKSLRAALEKIADPSIRGHYGEEIKRLRRELFGYDASNDRAPWTPRKSGGAKPWRGQPLQAAAMESTKSSPVTTADERMMEDLRESVILATLLTHPVLLDEFSYTLEELPLNGEGHTRIAKALLTARATDAATLRAEVEAQIGAQALEKLMSPRHVQICPSVRHADDAELARLCLAEELAKLTASRGAAQEVAEAMQQLSGDADESVTWRLGQAAAARHKSLRSDDGDTAEFDIAPNGARMDRQERSAFETLLRTISGESPVKPDG